VVKRTDGVDMTDEHELTPEEKMAFQRLPREEQPSPFLEERVVNALREEGTLRDGSGKELEPGNTPAVAGGAVSTGGKGRWYRPWMIAASIAASLILFGSGVVMGERMGSRTTAQVFMQVREQDAAQLALRIQEAGSAYVGALAALGDLQNQSLSRGGQGALSGAELSQGREVALGALYGAVNELARLIPDDADVFRVVQILEERRARDEGWGGNDRNVVWF